MSQCNEIQKRIAELGLNDKIKNPETLNHLESCQTCQDYQNACNEMNRAISEFEEKDADDALVESTLNSILSLQHEKKKTRSLLNTQWASALAASFMLVSLIALFPYNSVSNFGIFSNTNINADSMVVSDEEKLKIKKRKEALTKTKQDTKEFEFIDIEVSEETHQKQRRIPKKPAPTNSRDIIGRIEDDRDNESLLNISTALKIAPDNNHEKLNKSIKDELKQDVKNELAKLSATQPLHSPQELDELQSGESLEESVRVKLNSEGLGQVLVYPKEQDQIKDKPMLGDGFAESPSSLSARERQGFDDLSKSEENDSFVIADAIIREEKNIKHKTAEKTRLGLDERRKQMHKDASVSNRDRLDEGDDQVGELEPITVTGNRIKLDGIYNIPNSSGKKTNIGKKGNTGHFKQSSAKSKTRDVHPEKLTPARGFLAELDSLDNIKYQNATGYWANNYLPGDANMRLLGAELLKNDVDIQSIVDQNRQPFDYPTNSALEVYMSSDQAFVKTQEPTRMKLQVGIQASNRKGGHRSAMNIGLVLDVNGINENRIKKVKSLLLALLKAKQSNDNISVTLAGINGGQVIKASEFRYGTIQNLLNRIESNKIKKPSVVISLHQAIKLASVNLQKEDDPTASLGSSVVMLVTDKNINNIEQIVSTVHSNAVNGLTLSTISLGTDNQQLNQLALAGQGHSRILHNENDAKRVIDAEILASSRAVARALRLRIRLAKGVKLIKILDSYNLNENQAQRVRDAENSLDQRLSKNLGIKADRGEDEEGIQIVIPSFYAGDTHVVILDLVVNNPGAIADVTLRYKDLLYLRNAISRKQLNLTNDNKALGPLQLNVIKNVLASRFSKDIKQSSHLIKKRDNGKALSILLSLQKLYQSMRQVFPIWNNDAEILKDEELIQQYIELINQSSMTNTPQINYIINSMQYISWRKNITQSK